jgi:hypothetical protein
VVKLPATIFLLADGRELQAERYTITGEYVYISQNAWQSARIRLDTLNIPATIGANRRNGIELRIPSTPSEFFLSY